MLTFQKKKQNFIKIKSLILYKKKKNNKIKSKFVEIEKKNYLTSTLFLKLFEHFTTNSYKSIKIFF